MKNNTINNENIKVISVKRKLQVLEKFEGYCPICKEQTPQILVYVYKKYKIPIYLFIVIIFRYWPDFYGIICEKCNTVIKIFSNSKEMAKKYKKSWFFEIHKNAVEDKPRNMEIRIITIKK
ncbi:hypothetical protein YN1_5570 [Nanoarchaeota archaeon]